NNFCWQLKPIKRLVVFTRVLPITNRGQPHSCLEDAFLAVYTATSLFNIKCLAAALLITCTVSYRTKIRPWMLTFLMKDWRWRQHPCSMARCLILPIKAIQKRASDLLLKRSGITTDLVPFSYSTSYRKQFFLPT